MALENLPNMIIAGINARDRRAQDNINNNFRRDSLAEQIRQFDSNLALQSDRLAVQKTNLESNRISTAANTAIQRGYLTQSQNQTKRKNDAEDKKIRGAHVNERFRTPDGGLVNFAEIKDDPSAQDWINSHPRLKQYKNGLTNLGLRDIGSGFEIVGDNSNSEEKNVTQFRGKNDENKTILSADEAQAIFEVLASDDLYAGGFPSPKSSQAYFDSLPGDVDVNSPAEMRRLQPRIQAIFDAFKIPDPGSDQSVTQNPGLESPNIASQPSQEELTRGDDPLPEASPALDLDEAIKTSRVNLQIARERFEHRRDPREDKLNEEQLAARRKLFTDRDEAKAEFDKFSKITELEDEISVRDKIGAGTSLHKKRLAKLREEAQQELNNPAQEKTAVPEAPKDESGAPEVSYSKIMNSKTSDAEKAKHAALTPEQQNKAIATVISEENVLRLDRKKSIARLMMNGNLSESQQANARNYVRTGVWKPGSIVSAGGDVFYNDGTNNFTRLKTPMTEKENSDRRKAAIDAQKSGVDLQQKRLNLTQDIAKSIVADGKYGDKEVGRLVTQLLSSPRTIEHISDSDNPLSSVTTVLQATKTINESISRSNNSWGSWFTGERAYPMTVSTAVAAMKLGVDGSNSDAIKQTIYTPITGVFGNKAVDDEVFNTVIDSAMSILNEKPELTPRQAMVQAAEYIKNNNPGAFEK